MTIKLNPFQTLIDVVDTILWKNEYTEEPTITLHVTEISSLPQSGIGAQELTKYLRKLHADGVINYNQGAISKLTKDNEQKLFAERKRLEDKWYGQESFDKPKIELAKQTILFNDDETNIEIGNQKCALPPYKNEHYLCRAMFQHKPQEFVDWSQVYKAMFGSEEVVGDKNNMRTVQDTMYALNTRIKKVIRTDDNLFTWENHSIKRNF